MNFIKSERHSTESLSSIGETPPVTLDGGADPGDTPFSAWWQAFIRGAPLTDNSTHAPFTVVDLFSGAGGFGLGIALATRAFRRRAEFRCIVDADAAGMAVYAKSLPVRQLLNDSVAAMVDYRVRERGGHTRFAYEPEILHPILAREAGLDLLIAGPPCQGHSNLNNHTRRNDPRNDLYVATVAIAVALKARIIIIENVPTVLRSHGEVVRISRELLDQAGYDLDEGILRADAIGGAQTRARYFMIATHRGHQRRSPAGGLKQWARNHRREACSVNWAIGDLEALTGSNLFDTAPQPNAENLRRIHWLFDHGVYDLANDQRPECHRDGTTYTAVYGRMRGDCPAPTITTGIGTPGQGRFIHPNLRRLITPHEAARIQGFPDWYAFADGSRPRSRKALAKWIGDAVPPILGMSAGIVAIGASLGQEPTLPWEERVDHT